MRRVLAVLQVEMISRAGVALTQPLFNVSALSDGKLRRVDAYQDEDEALRAVGPVD
jgi:hypothetical protein